MRNREPEIVDVDYEVIDPATGRPEKLTPGQILDGVLEAFAISLRSDGALWHAIGQLMMALYLFGVMAIFAVGANVVWGRVWTWLGG